MKQTPQSKARHPSNNIGDSYAQNFRAFALSLIGLCNFNQKVIRDGLPIATKISCFYYKVSDSNKNDKQLHSCRLQIDSLSHLASLNIIFSVTI